MKSGAKTRPKTSSKLTVHQFLPSDPRLKPCKKCHRVTFKNLLLANCLTRSLPANFRSNVISSAFRRTD